MLPRLILQLYLLIVLDMFLLQKHFVQFFYNGLNLFHYNPKLLCFVLNGLLKKNACYLFFFFQSLGILLSIKMTLIHFKRGLRFQAVSGLLCVTLEISPSSGVCCQAVALRMRTRGHVVVVRWDWTVICLRNCMSLRSSPASRFWHRDT